MDGIPQIHEGRRLRWCWPYFGESGEPLNFQVARFDATDNPGDKVCVPFRPNGKGWKAGALPEPRPLFGLDTLPAARDRGAAVAIVEGEKAASALHSLRLASVTSPGGANSARMADWSPLNGCKRVYVLPDRNEPGERYARDVCGLLAALPEPPELFVVELPGRPPGGDVVDFLQARLSGWDGFQPIPEAERDRLAGELQATIKAHASPPPPDWTGTDWPTPEPLPEPGDAAPADFPVEALPPVLLEAAREVARFVKVPIASPAVVALAIVAVAIGKRARIVERKGLSHWAALFFALVVGSGERKSPVFALLLRPPLDWLADELPNWEAAKRKAEALNRVIDARIRGLEAAAKKAGSDVELNAADIAALDGQRLPVPPHPRMFTSNATPEMLFRLLDAHGGAYAVLSGEGRDVLDNIMGKYQSDGRTGDSIYLAGISGDTITRDRIGGDTGPEERYIVSPCLNVCIMVQPGKWREVATHPALRDSGALARVWPVLLPAMAGTRFEEADEPDLDEMALSGFANAIKALLQREPGEKPHRVTLSPEAKEGRRRLANQIEALQPGELADVQDIASKATSQAVKLALVLHLLENPEALAEPHSEVSGDTWARAQALGLFFLSEAVRTQREALEDDALQPARVVLGWIRRQQFEEVTARMLAQYSPRPRPTAEEADEILDLLTEYGWLKPYRDPNHRKPVYRVHPALCSQSSQCSQPKGGK